MFNIFPSSKKKVQKNKACKNYIFQKGVLVFNVYWLEKLKEIKNKTENRTKKEEKREAKKNTKSEKNKRTIEKQVKSAFFQKKNRK